MFFLFILIWFMRKSSVICDKSCSREGSRMVREYFTEALVPIYEKNHLSIPFECVFSSKRDIFYQQELNKIKLTNKKWLCNYCNKTFHSEYYLDTHLSNRHNNTLNQDEQAVCLSEYCSIFRCEVLKQSKKSLNPLARGGDLTIKNLKKNVNEQQFIILRSRCASIINQCIPHNINYDIRVKMQHEMYAEVCAYLTSHKYFELPNYRKSLLNFTSIFCLSILIGICFIVIGFVRHFDRRFGNNDEDESDKHLSDEAISTATALLSKTPANGIIHSSKNSTSTIRHRVRFKSLDEC
jgi:hypothetical protein